MKDPQKEVKRLLENPVHAKNGSIFVDRSCEPSVRLDLNPFPGRSFGGSLFMFSPEEWVRVVEVMRAYFKKEKNSS